MASFPFALSLPDGLGVGQGAEKGTLELNAVDNQPMGTLSLPFQSRQPFRVADHPHVAFTDDVACLEIFSETSPVFGVGAVDESSTLRGVLLHVVFQELIVAVASRLIGSASYTHMIVSLEIQSGLCGTSSSCSGRRARCQMPRSTAFWLAFPQASCHQQTRGAH